MPAPPPPPGPPPPPMSGLSPVHRPAATSNSVGDKRGALLSQIQKGTKLKKVTTVDKSTPLVSGKIAGESSQASSPVKSSKSSPDSSLSSPVSSRGAAVPKGFMSLTDELQHKLTLKKNKQSPVKETTSKETSPPNFLNEMKSKQQLQQNVISPYHHQVKPQSSTSVNTNHASSPNLSDVVPNKSSLFNTQKSQTNVAAHVPSQGQPKMNYGKPNLAPKPPAQLSLAINNNNSNSSDRKSVARHQSMKSPRSPPIAPLSSSDNHFATIRSPSNYNKIQDALNLQLSSQKPGAQRPTNKPPPPPVPNRNLNTQMHAKSTTALNNMQNDQVLNAPRCTPNTDNSGSSNNVSDAVDAPPLPPHRVTSRVPQTQQTAPSNHAIPPEVPRRHSSMRNSESGVIVSNNQINNRHPSPNTNQPITRLVVDLEARYSLLFHSFSEFPAPKQFMNVPKSYPSFAVRPSNGII